MSAAPERAAPSHPACLTTLWGFLRWRAGSCRGAGTVSGTTVSPSRSMLHVQSADENEDEDAVLSTFIPNVSWLRLIRHAGLRADLTGRPGHPGCPCRGRVRPRRSRLGSPSTAASGHGAGRECIAGNHYLDIIAAMMRMKVNRQQTCVRRRTLWRSQQMAAGPGPSAGDCGIAGGQQCAT